MIFGIRGGLERKGKAAAGGNGETSRSARGGWREYDSRRRDKPSWRPSVFAGRSTGRCNGNSQIENHHPEA